MTKLKFILQSKCFYLISVIIICFYIIIVTVIIKYDTVYEDTSNIIGTIIKVSEKNNKVSYLIKNKENILVEYYYKDLKLNYKEGDIIQVSGERKEINNPTIPNTFNYKKYLYNHQIYLVIKANELNLITKNTNFLNTIKVLINNRINNNSYLALFILGDKSFLESDIYDSYKSIGVAHLLAISGLHLGILLFVLNKVLFLFKDNYKFIIITIILLIYAYLINFPPSFLRVFVFYVLSFINKKNLLQLNNIELLFLTIFILLLINPFYLYDTGFQYSFVTVFGIFLCKKYLHYNYFVNLFLLTVIAFLFTLPITVNINYEINILSFISNILLVPFVSFIVYPFSLLSFFIPWLLPLFNILTIIMEKIAMFFASFEFTKIYIPKISIFLIIAYYLLLIYIIYFNKKRLYIFLFILLIINKYFILLNNDYQISFYDVGQGDSISIMTPHSQKIIMIDTGGIANSNYHLINNVIMYLKSIGVSRIDTLILTQGH